MDIKSVGTTQDYSICVMLNDLKLKKDTAYKITFQAKSTVARHFETNVMDPDHDYAWFGGATDKELTTEFKTYTVDIPKNRDKNYDCSTAMLQFSLGYFKDYADACAPSVVTIKDLYMEEVEEDASAPEEKPAEPDADGVMTKPIASDWSTWTAYANDPAAADIRMDDNAVEFNITNVGNNDYDIALEYRNKLRLEKGATYKIVAKIKSSVARTTKVSLMDSEYKWYGGKDMVLDADVEYNLSEQFTVEDKDTVNDITFKFSLGQIENVTTPVGSVKISDVSLVKVEDTSAEIPSDKPIGDIEMTTQIKADWSTWTAYANDPAAADIRMDDNAVEFNITNVGNNDYDIALEYRNKLRLEKGATYKIVAKIKSSVARTTKVSLMDSEYKWYGGKDMVLDADVEYNLSEQFTVEDKETTDDITFKFSMGKIKDEDTQLGKITISNVVLYKINN